MGVMTSGKFIGVEMVGVVQASYIGLMVVKKIQPVMEPLMRMGFVNGVNTLLSDQRRRLVTDGTVVNGVVPVNVAALEYDSQMAYSFNYTVILLLLPPLMSLIFFIASKITKSK